MTGDRKAGRLIHVLAALVVLAELVGTIAFLRSDRSEQVVEAAPTPTPLPPVFGPPRELMPRLAR